MKTESPSNSAQAKHTAAEFSNPYEVPPFDPGTRPAQVRFVWWSWHPSYPYWSKSCWEADTIEKAWEVLSNPMASSMQYYHNKLIREGDGAFTEVAEDPCRRLDVWRKIKQRDEAARATGAQP